MRTLQGAAREAVLDAARTPHSHRTPQQTAQLLKVLRCVPALGGMDVPSLRMICAAASYEEAEEDEQVADFTQDSVAEGDEAAAAVAGGLGVALVLFGEIRATRTMPSDASTQTGVLRAGDHFGNEGGGAAQAGGPGGPGSPAVAARSMVAVERAGLLRVAAADLGRTIQRAQLEAAGDKAMFVVSVPMFARLPWERLLRLVAQLQPRAYARGETIVMQGETPTGLHILQEGRCTVERELSIVEGGRRRTRKMHLETLMPRDTFGGDALLHGSLRNHASLLADQEVAMLFLPRADFSSSQLTEDAIRMIKLNAKLYRPNDEVLRQRHYNQLEWDRAKHHFVNGVLAESKARRTAGRKWF